MKLDYDSAKEYAREFFSQMPIEKALDFHLSCILMLFEDQEDQEYANGEMISYIAEWRDRNGERGLLFLEAFMSGMEIRFSSLDKKRENR